MIRSIDMCSCVVLLSLFSALVWASEFGCPAPLPPPFQLTSGEQLEVDRLLDKWERWNSQLKTFDCCFKRWTYDVVFGSPTQPKFIDRGIIKYAAAPNRVVFCVDMTEKDGMLTPIDDCRAEHFVFDGKSVFEFNRHKKILIEYQLPMELEGIHFVDGPLGFSFVSALIQRCFFRIPLYPYPFGAKAEELRQCHYVRTMPPPNRSDEIRLEAYPRSRQFASQHQKIQLIFAAKDMSPVALKIMQPNGKDCTVYEFFDLVINETPSRATDDPFHPTAPLGWQKIVEETPMTGQTRHSDGNPP